MNADQLPTPPGCPSLSAAEDRALARPVVVKGYARPINVVGHETGLRMVDAATGRIIWSAGPPGSGADLELDAMQYPLRSSIAPVDSNRDGAIDRGYVGDAGGQLWRFDFTAVADPLHGPRLKGTAFVFARVSADLRAAPDVVSMETEDLITISAGRRLYAFRDRHVRQGPPGDTPEPLTLADLHPAGAAGGFIPPRPGASRGWYVDLGTPNRETLFTRTTTFGGALYVTTFTPPAPANLLTPPCPGRLPGLLKLYSLDPATGLDTAQNSTRNVPQAIASHSGLPTKFRIVTTPDGRVMGRLGTGDAPNPRQLLERLPRLKTYWYVEP